MYTNEKTLFCKRVIGLIMWSMVINKAGAHIKRDTAGAHIKRDTIRKGHHSWVLPSYPARFETVRSGPITFTKKRTVWIDGYFLSLNY